MSRLTIQSIAKCEAVSKCMASPSSYASSLSSYTKPSGKLVAEHALRQLEAARALDVEIHEANLPSIENNLAVLARVEALMGEIGMPPKWIERDTNSRARYPKTVTREAGWIIDMRRECKTDDGFAQATSVYEGLLERYKAYANEAEIKAEQEKRKAEREQAAVIERRKADMELAALLLRYSLPIDSTWRDVLEHLRSMDQRLDLAVAMQQTREDWSEGPYRVSDALGRFTIQNDEDKEIVIDVADCLCDFNDGRVFRNTQWSYSALFGSIANRQLVDDCATALKRI